MAKYIRPEVLEVFDFDDLIKYGKDHGGNIVDGIPWSFSLMGYPVTNEDENTYLITGEHIEDIWFNRGEYLIFGNGKTPFVVEEIPEELKLVDEKADLSRYFAGLNLDNASLRVANARLEAENKGLWEALEWKPYPENKPTENIEYDVTIQFDGDYLLSADYWDKNGDWHFYCHQIRVVAFRRKPPQYQPESKDTFPALSPSTESEKSDER